MDPSSGSNWNEKYRKLPDAGKSKGPGKFRIAASLALLAGYAYFKAVHRGDPAPLARPGLLVVLCATVVGIYYIPTAGGIQLGSAIGVFITGGILMSVSVNPYMQMAGAGIFVGGALGFLVAAVLFFGPKDQVGNPGQCGRDSVLIAASVPG